MFGTMKILLLLSTACFCALAMPFSSEYTDDSNYNGKPECFYDPDGDYVEPIYYPHPRSCSHYYECFQGVLVVAQCLPGLHFNPQAIECDFPEKANCVLTTRREEMISKHQQQPNNFQLSSHKADQDKAHVTSTTQYSTQAKVIVKPQVEKSTNKVFADNGNSKLNSDSTVSLHPLSQTSSRPQPTLNSIHKLDKLHPDLSSKYAEQNNATDKKMESTTKVFLPNSTVKEKSPSLNKEENKDVYRPTPQSTVRYVPNDKFSVDNYVSSSTEKSHTKFFSTQKVENEIHMKQNINDNMNYGNTDVMPSKPPSINISVKESDEKINGNSFLSKLLKGERNTKFSSTIIRMTEIPSTESATTKKYFQSNKTTKKSPTPTESELEKETIIRSLVPKPSGAHELKSTNDRFETKPDYPKTSLPKNEDTFFLNIFENSIPPHNEIITVKPTNLIINKMALNPSFGINASATQSELQTVTEQPHQITSYFHTLARTPTNAKTISPQSLEQFDSTLENRKELIEDILGTTPTIPFSSVHIPTTQFIKMTDNEHSFNPELDKEFVKSIVVEATESYQERSTLKSKVFDNEKHTELILTNPPIKEENTLAASNFIDPPLVSTASKASNSITTSLDELISNIKDSSKTLEDVYSQSTQDTNFDRSINKSRMHNQQIPEKLAEGVLNSNSKEITDKITVVDYVDPTVYSKIKLDDGTWGNSGTRTVSDDSQTNTFITPMRTISTGFPNIGTAQSDLDKLQQSSITQVTALEHGMQMQSTSNIPFSEEAENSSITMFTQTMNSLLNNTVALATDAPLRTGGTTYFDSQVISDPTESLMKTTEVAHATENILQNGFFEDKSETSITNLDATIALEGQKINYRITEFENLSEAEISTAASEDNKNYSEINDLNKLPTNEAYPPTPTSYYFPPVTESSQILLGSNKKKGVDKQDLLIHSETSTSSLTSEMFQYENDDYMGSGSSLPEYFNGLVFEKSNETLMTSNTDTTQGISDYINLKEPENTENIHDVSFSIVSEVSQQTHSTKRGISVENTSSIYYEPITENSILTESISMTNNLIKHALTDNGSTEILTPLTENPFSIYSDSYIFTASSENTLETPYYEPVSEGAANFSNFNTIVQYLMSTNDDIPTEVTFENSLATEQNNFLNTIEPKIENLKASVKNPATVGTYDETEILFGSSKPNEFYYPITENSIVTESIGFQYEPLTENSMITKSLKVSSEENFEDTISTNYEHHQKSFTEHSINIYHRPLFLLSSSENTLATGKSKVLYEPNINYTTSTYDFTEPTSAINEPTLSTESRSYLIEKKIENSVTSSTEMLNEFYNYGSVTPVSSPSEAHHEPSTDNSLSTAHTSSFYEPKISLAAHFDFDSFTEDSLTTESHRFTTLRNEEISLHNLNEHLIEEEDNNSKLTQTTNGFAIMNQNWTVYGEDLNMAHAFDLDFENGSGPGVNEHFIEPSVTEMNHFLDETEHPIALESSNLATLRSSLTTESNSMLEELLEGLSTRSGNSPYNINTEAPMENNVVNENFQGVFQESSNLPFATMVEYSPSTERVSMLVESPSQYPFVIETNSLVYSPLPESQPTRQNSRPFLNSMTESYNFPSTVLYDLSLTSKKNNPFDAESINLPYEDNAESINLPYEDNAESLMVTESKSVSPAITKPTIPTATASEIEIQKLTEYLSENQFSFYELYDLVTTATSSKDSQRTTNEPFSRSESKNFLYSPLTELLSTTETSGTFYVPSSEQVVTKNSDYLFVPFTEFLSTNKLENENSVADTINDGSNGIALPTVTINGLLERESDQGIRSDTYAYSSLTEDTILTSDSPKSLKPQESTRISQNLVSQTSGYSTSTSSIFKDSMYESNTADTPAHHTIQIPEKKDSTESIDTSFAGEVTVSKQLITKDANATGVNQSILIIVNDEDVELPLTINSSIIASSPLSTIPDADEVAVEQTNQSILMNITGQSSSLRKQVSTTSISKSETQHTKKTKDHNVEISAPTLNIAKPRVHGEKHRHISEHSPSKLIDSIQLSKLPTTERKDPSVELNLSHNKTNNVIENFTLDAEIPLKLQTNTKHGHRKTNYTKLGREREKSMANTKAPIILNKAQIIPPLIKSEKEATASEDLQIIPKIQTLNQFSEAQQETTVMSETTEKNIVVTLVKNSDVFNHKSEEEQQNVVQNNNTTEEYLQEELNRLREKSIPLTQLNTSYTADPKEIENLADNASTIILPTVSPISDNTPFEKILTTTYQVKVTPSTFEVEKNNDPLQLTLSNYFDYALLNDDKIATTKETLIHFNSSFSSNPHLLDKNISPKSPPHQGSTSSISYETHNISPNDTLKQNMKDDHSQSTHTSEKIKTTTKHRNATTRNCKKHKLKLHQSTQPHFDHTFDLIPTEGSDEIQVINNGGTERTTPFLLMILEPPTVNNITESPENFTFTLDVPIVNTTPPTRENQSIRKQPSVIEDRTVLNEPVISNWDNIKISINSSQNPETESFYEEYARNKIKIAVDSTKETPRELTVANSEYALNEETDGKEEKVEGSNSNSRSDIIIALGQSDHNHTTSYFTEISKTETQLPKVKSGHRGSINSDKRIKSPTKHRNMTTKNRLKNLEYTALAPSIPSNVVHPSNLPTTEKSEAKQVFEITEKEPLRSTLEPPAVFNSTVSPENFMPTLGLPLANSASVDENQEMVKEISVKEEKTNEPITVSTNLNNFKSSDSVTFNTTERRTLVPNIITPEPAISKQKDGEEHITDKVKEVKILHKPKSHHKSNHPTAALKNKQIIEIN